MAISNLTYSRVFRLNAFTPIFVFPLGGGTVLCAAAGSEVASRGQHVTMTYSRSANQICVEPRSSPFFPQDRCLPFLELDLNQFAISGHGEVDVGQFTHVGDGAQIVFVKPGRVVIGDYCNVGPGVKFVCSGGDVTIGDWTSLHDNCLVLCGDGVHIGAHGWFGQNCVIDGSGGISIGCGVRVGMYSQLWSHVAAGEQVEGCTLFGERPVVIEDDVWLVGSCIVASGVTLGKRTVALIGSNITKSWPANSVLAGTPASQKAGMSFYQNLTLEEKWAKLSGWIRDAAAELDMELELPEPQIAVLRDKNMPGYAVAFVRDRPAATQLRTEAGLTVCCLADKTYNKRLNSTERRVLKYFSSNKARFNAVV